MKRADFKGIGERFSIDPVTARIIRNRDIIEPEDIDKYLNGGTELLYDPALLKDGRNAAQILKEKIRSGKKIRIISDYDCDGVCSNYILYKGLTRCGAQVDYVIPHRIEDGYGISRAMVEDAAHDGIDTIITCDNGISAMEQVLEGNRLGITIIITDHHEIPCRITDDGKKEYLIPPAAAVVDPIREDCPYPFKSICGAVVAFKVIQLLYDEFGIDRKETEAFYEICALATVCDVMPLQDENRILVREGLGRMPHTGIPGLKALIRATQIDGKELTGYHLGFILGPCINASGRLASAEDALKLLLCEDPVRCMDYAQKLKAMNEERKELCRKGEDLAFHVLEESGHLDDKVLVIWLPEVHESIAGIIAGHIKERYNKPTFVVTGKEEVLKGSGRSIPAFSMYEEMSAIGDCFTRYGGHPMAAGFSLEKDRLEEFRARINQNSLLTEEDFCKVIDIDIPMPVSYLSENLIEEFHKLEPFGNGNRKPLFAQKDLLIRSCRVLGKNGSAVKLFLTADTGAFPSSTEALLFQDSKDFFDEMARHYGENAVEGVKRGTNQNVRLAVTYYPQINEWQGRKNIQIVIQNYRFTDRK